MKIKEELKVEILSNNSIIGKLISEFNRGQKTIESWVVKDDIRLTTPPALRILSTELNLNPIEIFQ